MHRVQHLALLTLLCIYLHWWCLYSVASYTTIYLRIGIVKRMELRSLRHSFLVIWQSSDSLNFCDMALSSTVPLFHYFLRRNEVSWESSKLVISLSMNRRSIDSIPSKIFSIIKIWNSCLTYLFVYKKLYSIVSISHLYYSINDIHGFNNYLTTHAILIAGFWQSFGILICIHGLSDHAFMVLLLQNLQ